MTEKIKHIIHRARYVTEFLATIIFIFFLAQVIYIKEYGGYFHKLYCIGTAIWFLILAINIIYNLKKSENKVEKVFLNIAIPIGLLFLVFMIPGHVPDDTTHFLKIYDVSKGNLVTKIDENGESLIEVPTELNSFNYTIIKNYKDFINLAQQKTDYENTEKVISAGQSYSFIMYIFSGLSFFITRVLNLGLAYGILLGRVFNFIFFLVLGYLAIKKIPFGKIVLSVYMIMPMNLQQVTSISPDAFINSILLYYIAFSIYMIFKEEKITKKELILYLLFTAIAGIIKMVYILIAGVGFLIVKRKDISSKNKILIISITLIIGGIFTIGTYMNATKYKSIPEVSKAYYEQYNIDSGKQISKIIEEPIHVIKALKNDWYDRGKEYIYMAIGSQLGWLEIKPSETIITAYLIILIIATLSEKNNYEFNLKEKIWLILIVTGVIFLVECSMYTSFTPVGAEFIGGVQGRYYIPIYILLLLCLSKKDNYVKIKNVANKFLLISGILNLCVIVEMCKYFI